MGIEKAQYATGAEISGLRVNAAVDVLNADPLRGFNPVHQLDGNRRVVKEYDRTDQQLTQQLDHVGHALGARGHKTPAAQEQIAVNGRQFSAGKVRHRAHHTARLFQQTQFAALVVTEFFREFFRRAGHRQLFGLLDQRTETAFIELRQVTPTVTQGHVGPVGSRQNDLGITEVKQAFFAVALEHVLGQSQVAAPGRNRGFHFAILLPGQVAHRDTRQLSQTLNHHRVRGHAATKALPGLCVNRRVNNAPAALTPALEIIEHQAPAVRSVTCGNCQNRS